MLSARVHVVITTADWTAILPVDLRVDDLWSSFRSLRGSRSTVLLRAHAQPVVFRRSAESSLVEDWVVGGAELND